MKDIFLNNLPSIDLHGYDRETARVAINDFIKDNLHMKKPKILIIHGKGTGILRQATKDALSKNKYVKTFQTSYFNEGCTIVELKI